MQQVTFTVPGLPQGKGRARSASRIIQRGGKAVAITKHYTPAKTVSYESLVRLVAQQAMGGRPPFRGAIRLDLDIVMAAPLSWSAKRRQRAMAGEIAPTVKPDKDNIEKAICDGMNGVAIVDDSRIVDGAQRKRYGLVPGITVVVTELDIEPAQGKSA